jgi:bacillithiol biosynthesis cysteine-adding enzyme BshC
MATEDHDYDEIKYFKLYGKKYVWETDQKGAVGRFSTKDMMALLNEVPGDIKIFREAYTKGKTLREATRLFVNSLFGKDGLVVVDGDDVLLKSSFKAVIEADVVQHVVKPLVDKTDQALKQHGYEAQIYSREINFFYLDENVRARIERKDNQYHVVDTQIYFSEAEMDALINTNPERFSPNVVLRPLYQEYLLPNVAYVGGPAEVIYWLQLKGVFDHFGVTYPMIMPRNFGLVVDHTITRKLERTGLPLEDFFEEKNYLFNHWVLTYSPRNLTLGEERNKLLLIFEELEKRAASVDQSLVSFVAAEAQRAKHSLETIEHKMLRAEKRLHKEKLGQIEAVKDALFPGGGLQERVDNFLNFYQQDDQFIERVKNAFDPFDFSFNVLIYDSPAS